ncbi:hypothetical protein BBJ28_00022966 [Nothophytophthora sp. Chile5]|nr:hypothetical protein BBJ28_00022966 [Nothophytophthora sp. Chile5]
MQRAVLTRRRAFSQQALRRWEEVSSGRRASTVKPSSSPQELDGRSYLLPTLTLSKASSVSPAAAGKDAKDSQFFQARANKPTPVVLDLQHVSNDGT